jgi:GntR family transcriptional regulator/MocR family aminotransferase
MDIRIDRDSDRPLFLQIVEEVERLASEGQVGDGHRMPPTRELARRLGVNRNTVVAAYQELESRGRTTAHTGRGTFLRSSPSSGGPGIPWEETLGRAVDRRTLTNTLDLHGACFHEAEIALARNFPADELLPADGFRQALDSVLESHGADVLAYGSPAGHLPLRQWLSEKITREGARVSAEQVAITTGSQQAIDLAARAFLRSGDTVLMAEPGFAGALSSFQAYGARVNGLESDDQGIRLDALQRALERGPARLLYLVPNFHNPTGVTMSAERRLRVLEIAARHRLPILEDDPSGDLRFEGERLPSLLALDRAGVTTHISSFSKTLLPGLRVGWMTGPAPVREHLMALKQLTDCTTSLLLQAALHEFCRRGLFDEHLDRVRRIYRERRDAMVAAMRRHFPAGARWTEPQGGLALWVTLPEGTDGRELLVEARDRGVTFNPGELFYAGSPRRNQIRLTFGTVPVGPIRRGINILGELLARRQGPGVPRRTDQEAVPLV